MTILATLTEVRKDGMQKWERSDLPTTDHMRYIWLNAYQSNKDANIGSQAKLDFIKGTGGATGGHFSLWKVIELVK